MIKPARAATESLYVNALVSGSQRFKRFPRLHGTLFGKDNLPFGWQHIDAESLRRKPVWVHIPGDPDGHRFPIAALFPRVAILSANKAQLQRARAEAADARYALLLRIGEHMVVGAMASNRTFAYHQEIFRDNQQDVGTYVANLSFDAVAGIYYPEQHTFNPVRTELRTIEDQAGKVAPGIEILW